MRTAVYNRYWSTGGGAEKYGGVIAQVLSADGPLDLLTHDPVDVDWLADRLHLDLSRVDVRLIDDEPGSLTKASTDYDLFVNVSYMSIDRAGIPQSLYVIHFPSPLDSHLGPISRFVTRSDRLMHALLPVGMEWGDGFHHRDPGSGNLGWTNGEGTLHFDIPPGRTISLTLVFGHQRPAELGPTDVRIQVNGRTAREFTLAPPKTRLHAQLGVATSVKVKAPTAEVPAEVKVISDTFIPAEVLGGNDRRRLGVPLKSMRVGMGPWAPVTRWMPNVLATPGSSRWAGSYGALVSNSEFTKGWVKRWWDCDSEVLFPPVVLHKAQAKEPMILNVGRFFDSKHGHSKKQLELVQAFRNLCDRGVEGWSLHLVGGLVSVGQEYFDRVSGLAEGYPVELHPNASGEELEALYGRASIYWHASGFGEDAQRNPDRLEHFGITTAEAMSAGAVPVVIGLAGQLETVRHGIDGFHFRTLDELVQRTQTLTKDDALRAEMSAAAQARAKEFSVEAFEGRLRSIVERVRAGATGNPS
ncbi:MAG TPA: glycosyltransferase [Acidimicrobiales bacterium]